ncbi:MAG TPA: AMP-binding protein [Bryobacteraceae bacterium]|nr:AMP-binding protein [Bryobacteraceae bacterium]
MNAASLSFDNLERYGEYRKLYFEGNSWTNADRLRYAGSLAAVLRDCGVEPGDRVAVMMPNSPEVESAFQAIWMLGAAILPITPQLVAREVGYMLQDSGARVVLTSPALATRLSEAWAATPSIRHLLVFGASDAKRVIDIAAQVASAPVMDSMVDRAADDLALLLYTSGTTGHPKGVMLTHGNVLSGVEAALLKSPGMPRETLLQPLPLSHVYGVMVMNVSNVWGWTTILMPHFETARALKLIERYKPTRMSAIPTMLVYLINSPDREKYDTSSLAHVTSGGASLIESVRTEFERLYHCAVHQGYGLSETAAVATGYGYGEAYRPGSVGRALPGMELQIRDLLGRALPAGEWGEIAIRGPVIMKGYWNNPQATQAALAGGWLLTGDIGYLDADGFVYITDRRKDLIIKGGENIASKEVEDALHSHPSVAEVAVVGIPDDTHGENICAVVVLKPGSKASAEELLEHASRSITKFKLPARIVFVDALPKSPVGKILKREIRRQLSR